MTSLDKDFSDGVKLIQVSPLHCCSGCIAAFIRHQLPEH